MKFAILSLVLLPLVLILSAWVKMQFQLTGIRREPTEEELINMLKVSLIYTRNFALAIQKTQDEKEQSILAKEYWEAMSEISRMV